MQYTVAIFGVLTQLHNVCQTIRKYDFFLSRITYVNKKRLASKNKTNENWTHRRTQIPKMCWANEYLKRNTLARTHTKRILIESIESTRNVHLKLHNFYTGQTMQILHQWYKLCDSKCVVQSDQSAFEWETKPPFNELRTSNAHTLYWTQSRNNNDLAIICSLHHCIMCGVTRRPPVHHRKRRIDRQWCRLMAVKAHC